MTRQVAKKIKSESTNADGPHLVVKNTNKEFPHAMMRMRSTTLFLLTPQHPSLMRNKPLLNFLMKRTEPKIEDAVMIKAEKVGWKMTLSLSALRLRTVRSKVNRSVSAG